MVSTSIESLPTSTEQSLLLLGPLSRSSPTRVYIKKVVGERGEFCRRVHHGMKEVRTRGLLAMAYVYLSWLVVSKILKFGEHSNCSKMNVVQLQCVISAYM
jgi:hypothetical protein